MEKKVNEYFNNLEKKNAESVKTIRMVEENKIFEQNFGKRLKGKVKQF